MNINLGGFFKELINRLFATSPKFFVILKWVGLVCAFITGLPKLLTDNGIALPDNLVALENTAVTVAGAVAAFIASLTVANATTLTTQTNALPFSENHPVPKEQSIASVPKKKATVKTLHKK